MKRSNILSAASVSALLFFGMPLMNHAQGLLHVQTIEPGESGVSESVLIKLNKSMVVDLDYPAADILITNPEIADATVQTAKRLIFRGIKTGQTNAFIFDRNGNTLLNLEINVDIDTDHILQLVQKYVPGSRISIEPVNGSLLVSGQVGSLSESDQVMRLVKAFTATAEDEVEIVNMLSIPTPDQVNLQVRIVEMQRSVVKQLGINLSSESTNAFDDQILVSGLIDNALGVNGIDIGGFDTSIEYQNFVGTDTQSAVGARIKALERVGIVRTLAEPNIMAVSGETANFRAGGEFPVPVSQDERGVITIEFKKYGVALAFTPFVLSEGRISLRVSTEISELSNQGAYQGPPSNLVGENGEIVSVQGVTIPSLTVRKAESTVEIPSGKSVMLAGLIKSNSRETLDKLPGLKNLPVLGALFQSRDFINDETEMVVLITPYLVDPTSMNKLRTPADGYVNATDAKSYFFGKLNSQYAHADKGLSVDNYNAPVGFMEE